MEKIDPSTIDDKCKATNTFTLDGAPFCRKQNYDCPYLSNGKPVLQDNKFYRVCCYPNIPGKSNLR